MQRLLLSLLAAASTAEAKIQFMECKTVPSNKGAMTVIKGNVDPGNGASGALLIQAKVRDAVLDNDVVFGRDIIPRRGDDGRIHLRSEWVHELDLVLPDAKGQGGTVEMRTQGAIELPSPEPITCTFKEEDEGRLAGRDLCLENSPYCSNVFKRYPKPEEFKDFLSAAKEYDEEKPTYAARRLIRCEGWNSKSKTSFSFQGTMGLPRPGSTSVADHTAGPFVVSAKTEGTADRQFRLYPRDTLQKDLDVVTKIATVRTIGTEQFRFEYDTSGVARATIKGEKIGMTQSFKGPLDKCEVSPMTSEDLAAFEHCAEHYLGCLALRRQNGNKLPNRTELQAIRDLEKREAALNGSRN